MTNKIVHTFLAAMIFLLFATVAIGGSVINMPEFSLPSALDGKKVDSKDFRGKVLLVTFFTTWCPPCRKEIPALIKLQSDLGPKGFSIIGLSMDEKGPEVVVKLIKKEKINYPVLMGKSKTARDFGGVIGVPTSFLVDRQGVIVKRYPGYVPRSTLEKDIKSIL